VLRGAGFAFRKEMERLDLQRVTGAVFAFSSLLTPFFMGAVIGGIVAGKIPATATHASLAAWTGSMSLVTGFLFVGACGYLAAVYLVGEAAERGDRRMQAYFTRRAQIAGVVTGALSLAGLFVLDNSYPALEHRLTGRALPLVIIAGVTGVLVLGLLTLGRIRGIRVLAALGVASVIWGWGVAQYPTLLPRTDLTLTDAGAPHSTFIALVVLFVAVVVLIGPSFALLFSLQSRRVLGGDSEIALAAVPGGAHTTAGPRAQQSAPTTQGSLNRGVVLVLVAAVALIRALTRRRSR
jgi:cytochrome d ubiquinol oxidase subunit II